jgi:YD repeat-containing protein
VQFTDVGGSYVAGYFVRDVLTYDSSTDTYELVAPDGASKTFFGDSGLLAEMKDTFGNATTFNYNTDTGLLDSVVIGGDADRPVSYHYETDESTRLVESVTLIVGDAEVRRVNYAHTEVRELEAVTLQQNDGADTWSDVKTAYYRYFPGGQGLMQFALGNDAVLQMQSVDPSWPQTADDETLALYADRAFTYDDKRRVRTLTTNGGKYTSTFSYFKSAHSPSTVSVWRSKTDVLKPDGSTQTFYYNRSGSLLLQKTSEPQPSGPPKVWYPVCQQFDDNSRVVVKADSASVASVDESSPWLFTLKEDEGMNTVLQYDENGNLLLTGLRKGKDAEIVTQQETDYFSHTVGGVTLWYPESDTIYREATDSGATDPVTTSYEYEWHQKESVDTAQMSKRTAVLPAVPLTENGDGDTGTTEEHYDTYGFLTKQVDPMGVSTTYEYELEKGAVKTMVQDAGGMNLTTDYESDDLGRTTQTLGPVHTISLDGSAVPVRTAQWVQYLDAQDEVRNIQGYLNADDNTETIINPVQIQQSFAVDADVEGGRMTESIAAVYSGTGVPPETHTYGQADWVRWSTQHYDKGGEQTHSRVYHLIPETGSGNSPTNYAQTEFAYDSEGRRYQVTSPEGTIQRTVFNAMGWQMESLVGTSTTNLVTTAVREYDGSANQGDGNLTQVALKVDDNSGNDRVQNLSYDWRNRQTGTSASDGTVTIVTQRAYDNRNNVTQVDEYQTEVSTANLINRAQSFFDARNRLYRTKRFGVDITDGGALQPALTGETYYDQAGRTVRQMPAGKVGCTVSDYDALGRVTKSFHAFGPVPDEDLPPGDISTSTVLAQSEFTFDEAGNQVATLTRQRFDDATGTGELVDPTHEPKARVSYMASYPDAIGRTQAQANYGTNGGEAWTRPDTVPTPSDTVLVASLVFDDAGNQTESTDPMGTVTRQAYDEAGRRVALIENYIESGPSDPDVNKTTTFEYNLDGNLKTLTAENPTTDDQVTQWIYGVTVAQGSALESKALLYQKIYPNGTGTPPPITYTYNRQGQPLSMVDQAETTHAYSYDGFGRQTADMITNFGSGIDATMQGITLSYEVRGMLEKVTSLGAGSVVLNQVMKAYDAYSQLVKDYQAHSGTVDTDTTEKVTYHYADGSDNMVRPTGLTYPDGATTISIAYDGTDADALSRPDALKEGSTKLCSYRYLGSGTFIYVKYGDT